ncbi:hypothetical protein FWK35_00004809, partial [Aphis craccivora]
SPIGCFGLLLSLSFFFSDLKVILWYICISLISLSGLLQRCSDSKGILLRLRLKLKLWLGLKLRLMLRFCW